MGVTIKSLKDIFLSRCLRQCVLVVSCILVTSCSASGQSRNLPDTVQSKYLEVVMEFANNVLEHGRDSYGEIHSPLLVDGINIETGEPARWKSDGNSWVISNFASQQNLMRVLTGLTELTGDSRYRQAAEEAVRYMFEHQSDSNGLLFWGGHQFVDLETMKPQFEGRPHELKNHFPYYKLMWEVDPEATKQMLEAMWNAHVLGWEKLDLNRHGEYNLEMGALWRNTFNQPEPFFEGEGLTFINAGTDLVDAAITLHLLSGEDAPKEWGLRLYEQYVRARNPETGLGVYQYSQTRRTESPPAEGPLTGELTFSRYGDRAANQFGAVYGAEALEGNVLWGARIRTIYGQSSVMYLHLAEQLSGTPEGEQFRQWALDGLRALLKWGYIPGGNHFKPMWADGTDLTGQVYPRTGYYGRKGTPFRPIKPDAAMLFSYSKALKLSGGEQVFWEFVRNVFIEAGLGDPGASFDAKPDLNYTTEVSDATVLAAVLELHTATGNKAYLELAEKIGENIIDKHFHEGYFLPTKKHLYARFDTPEPLVLLMLEAQRLGIPGRVDAYVTGSGSTDGEPQENGRPSDDYLYELTIDDSRKNN